MTVTEIINRVLDAEGEEYSNYPEDRGHETKWGVTMPVLAEFRGCSVTVSQLQALTREEAFEVFEHLYANRSGFLQIRDERVSAMLIDFAVNAGIGAATKALQGVLGVTVDGICGPVTVAAVNSWDGAALLKRLGLARQKFYVGLVKRDPSQVVFLEGWLNRNWAVAVDPL
jgi:lysozyme family protein